MSKSQYLNLDLDPKSTTGMSLLHEQSCLVKNSVYFYTGEVRFLRVNSITFNNKFEETLKCCENPTLLTFKSLLIIYCYNCRTWMGSRENVNSYCRQFRPFTKGSFYGITLLTKLRFHFFYLMEFNLPSYRFKNFPWRNQIDFVTTDLSYYSTCN